MGVFNKLQAEGYQQPWESYHYLQEELTVGQPKISRGIRPEMPECLVGHGDIMETWTLTWEGSKVSTHKIPLTLFNLQIFNPRTTRTLAPFRSPGANLLSFFACPAWHDTSSPALRALDLALDPALRSSGAPTEALPLGLTGQHRAIERYTIYCSVHVISLQVTAADVLKKIDM